jgi:hypothetical protein
MSSIPSIYKELAGSLAESGSALVIALMATLLMTTLGSALLMICITETKISAHYRLSVEALYGADAAIERAIVDLRALPNWDNALSGVVTSSFTDGPPAGTRQLPGRTIDLTVLTNNLRCGKPSCSDDDVSTFSTERPWGRNNPLWQPYAWGPIRQDMTGSASDISSYIVVWIGDDQDDVDGDPLHDDPTSTNSGHGVVALIAHAYGPEQVRRVVAATIIRPSTAPQLKVVSWREVR